jgi:hypothetical protein
VGTRWLLPGFLLLPLIGILVAVDILSGEGIKLKAALIFPIGLFLMVLTVDDRRAPRVGPKGAHSPTPSASRDWWPRCIDHRAPGDGQVRGLVDGDPV